MMNDAISDILDRLVCALIGHDRVPLHNDRCRNNDHEFTDPSVPTCPGYIEVYQGDVNGEEVWRLYGVTMLANLSSCQRCYDGPVFGYPPGESPSFGDIGEWRWLEDDDRGPSSAHVVEDDALSKKGG